MCISAASSMDAYSSVFECLFCTTLDWKYSILYETKIVVNVSVKGIINEPTQHITAESIDFDLAHQIQLLAVCMTSLTCWNPQAQLRYFATIYFLKKLSKLQIIF